MKILLVGNHNQDSVHSLSMELFARVLYTGLLEVGHEAIWARPKPHAWARVADKPGWGKCAKYLDQFVGFPAPLRKLEDWADVVHVTDHSNAPLLSFLSGKPALVTCHDVIGIKRALGCYREERARWSGKILQSWTMANLRRADRIACVSANVASEIGELADIDADRLRVVHNGLNYPFCPMAREDADRQLAELGLPLDRPFVLHVGSDEWKKNRRGVAEIFVELKKLNYPAAGHLVFVGAPPNAELQGYLDREGVAHAVSAHGHLSSETLRALYSRAALFLFPSLYEGFGWPIVEAQACGALVATSDREPMREVGGGGAIHIDPENPRAAALAIAGLSEAEREALRLRGVANARWYSPEAMLAGYEAQYRALLESTGKSSVFRSAA